MSFNLIHEARITFVITPVSPVIMSLYQFVLGIIKLFTEKGNTMIPLGTLRGLGNVYLMLSAEDQGLRS